MHLHNNEPVVDDHQSKQGDEGTEEAVEVHEVVARRDRVVILEHFAVFPNNATKEDHPENGVNIEDDEEHSEELSERHRHVRDSLDYKPHHFDFYHKGDQLEHTDEDDHLKAFDEIVVLAVLIEVVVKLDHAEDVDALTEHLRERSERVCEHLLTVKDDLADQLSKPDKV